MIKMKIQLIDPLSTWTEWQFVFDDSFHIGLQWRVEHKHAMGNNIVLTWGSFEDDSKLSKIIWFVNVGKILAEESRWVGNNGN